MEEEEKPVTASEALNAGFNFVIGVILIIVIIIVGTTLLGAITAPLMPH